jgi:hypothetical protein
MSADLANQKMRIYLCQRDVGLLDLLAGLLSIAAAAGDVSCNLMGRGSAASACAS